MKRNKKMIKKFYFVFLEKLEFYVNKHFGAVLQNFN